MARKIIITAVDSNFDEKEDFFLLNDEWVCIKNQGTTTENLAGWILLKRKPGDNKHYDHFYFPALIGERKTEFKPGQMVFVMTGPGQDRFIPASEEGPSQYHFFRNLDNLILNNRGDKMCLFAHVRKGTNETYEMVDIKEIGK
ncbi:MAG: hypothetical protein ACM3UZ_11740 [Acidobacteriota bacterium]